MANDDSTPAWVDRPGPIGGLAEQRWYEEVRGVSPPEAIPAVKAVLKQVASDVVYRIATNEHDHAGGFAYSDKAISVAEVLSAWSLLPSLEKQAVHLAYLQGVPRRLIAKRQDCSLRTVYYRLARGLSHMVEAIWDYVPPATPDVLAALEDDGGDGRTSCRECGAYPGHSFPALADGYCPACATWQQERVR